MNKLFVATLLPLTLLSIHPAQAEVVNFDDLDTASYGSINVPDNYQGFVWGSLGNPRLSAISDAHWTGAGNYGNVGNDSPSGENAVFNSGIVDITPSNQGSFNFKGAFFAPFTAYNRMDWDSSIATKLIVEGYQGTNQVATASMDFTAAGYNWLQADMSGITSLKIYGTSPLVQPYQTRWTMDNFTYTPAATVVPVPAAFWLFSCGLLGLRFFSRPWRNRAA